MNDLNNDDFVTDVVNEYSDTIYRVALNITKTVLTHLMCVRKFL